MVYCGHEYTLNNLNFLISVFPNHIDLKFEKKKINKGKDINLTLDLSF